jgi:Cu2+-exporting ATPase
MIGAAAMSLSSFTVCMNALRLNLFKIHDASHDRPLKKKALPKPDTADETKTETLLVDGMMCEHCEARVKKALEKIDGITEAEADHQTGRVVIHTEKEIDPDLIRTAIEDEDYTYIGKEGEKKEMTKTVKIEGMMCEHCEASVKKALEKIDGVASAEVSHEAGTAIVELSADVDDAVLTQAVEDKDYKVLGIE